MKFDVKHFEKIHEDGRAIVLRHPKHGHQIVIAKDKLSPGMKAHFASDEQRMAQGGQVANLKENYHPEKLKAKNFKNGGGVEPTEENQQAPAQEENLPQFMQQDVVSQAVPNLAMKPETYMDAKQMTPEEEQKQIARQLYNQNISKESPEQFGVPFGETTESQKFGSKGEPPQNFNPELYKESEHRAENLEKTKEYNANAQANRIMKENEVRARAGLEPLPMPEGARVQQGQAPMPPQETVPGQPSSPNIFGVNYASALGGGMNGMPSMSDLTGAYQKIAEQEGKLGEQRANIEANTQKLLADQQQKFNETHAGIFNGVQQVIEDMKNNDIRPEHYMENLSVPGKISTAIGLILGGIGSGMTGQPSVAAQMLNNQIERDIMAQRANLGKKESLLSGYMNQYKSEAVAYDLTKATLLAKYASQIQEASDRSISPIAKERAKIQTAEMYMHMWPLLQRATMTQLMTAGGDADPAMKIQMFAPDKDRLTLMKDLQSMQNLVSQKNSILGAFDKVSYVNRFGKRVVHPFDTTSQIDSAWQPLVAKLAKDSEGRVTPADVDYLNKFKPWITDNEQIRRQKRMDLETFITERLHYPSLSVYGITPNNIMGRQQRKAISENAPMKPGVS
jgi:hypothetical protein